METGLTALVAHCINSSAESIIGSSDTGYSIYQRNEWIAGYEIQLRESGDNSPLFLHDAFEQKCSECVLVFTKAAQNGIIQRTKLYSSLFLIRGFSVDMCLICSKRMVTRVNAHRRIRITITASCILAIKHFLKFQGVYLRLNIRMSEDCIFFLSVLVWDVYNAGHLLVLFQMSNKGANGTRELTIESKILN